MGTLVFAITHIGCPVEEYGLEVDGYPPEFTFSSKSRVNSEKEGVKLSSVRFYELDARFNYVRTIWSIDRAPKQKKFGVLKHLKYGSPPSGWIQHTKALPIQDGVHYRLNSEYYFTKSNNGAYQLLTSDQVGSIAH